MSRTMGRCGNAGELWGGWEALETLSRSIPVEVTDLLITCVKVLDECDLQTHWGPYMEVLKHQSYSSRPSSLPTLAPLCSL
jgi:hypothetical protein